MLDFDENTIVFRIKKTSTFSAFVTSFGVALALFSTDILVGSELSFSIFYLLPITLAIFLSGPRLGVVFSVLCSLAWIYADIYSGQSFSNVYIPVWNTLVRFGYFIFHTLILSKLITLISEVREIGFRDPLTKAFNWRYFEEFTNNMLKAAARKRSRIALAYFDVDNFKKLNDTYGHNMGDQALIMIVDSVKSEIRGEDLLARLGGDEFVLIFQDVDVTAAQEILSRVKAKVTAEIAAYQWPISLSIGCIVFNQLSSTVGPMLKQVDELMYEVKHSGKNNLKVIEQFNKAAVE